MNEKQLNDEQMRATIKRMHAELEMLENAMMERTMSSIEKWSFPENEYTVLAIWLLYDPQARKLFPVHERKSWVELAQRLSKYVGWTVDEHTLRQNFTRRFLKIRK